MPSPLRIDVGRLVHDCGGVNVIVAMTAIERTAIYSILRRGRMHTDQLAQLLGAFPTLELRSYLTTEAPHENAVG